MIVARPNTDSDGDGMTDAAEIIAGTDPNDPNSVLRITALDIGNQQVIWDSVSNINYQVLGTTDLTLPFAPISPLIHASGSPSFFTDGFFDPTNKFYRIQIVP